ncbi:MAG TPA: 3-phosphoshikimate 1-carboxyvinyltransferase [Thermodesulfobacteriota bacterium]|nr:3-phosphoshikimate 1-carboxyvinyltransferase [Thermodesulfobacteriota bacterium]
MKISSEKSTLQGEVLIPASKSHTIRAVTLSSLARGKSIIRHPLVSSDCLAAVGAGRLFGAKIDLGDSWEVEGVRGVPQVPENVVDVKNSGTTLNFFMGAAGLVNGITVLTGDEQIVRRPVQPLIEALRDLGAEVCSTRNNGLPPVVVKGRIKGGKARLRGIVSQYVSSLLINCPLIEADCELEVYDVHEKPYVQMTMRWLGKQGIRYEASEDLTRFKTFGGQIYHGQEVTIPGDFSSATFFLVAGAMIDGDITLRGLDMDDVQGDKQVVSYLKEMGARISFEKDGIRIRGGLLRGVELDLSDTPDALPAMAVVGCFAEGKTVIRNVANARLKETDRISVMGKELSRLGARVEELPDGLIVHESRLRGCPLKGYGDHRVVMALAVAGLAIPGRTEVDTAESVHVTFPNFVELMQKLGAKMEKKD